MLALALVLGGLLAWSQLSHTLQYLRQSTRGHQTFEEKTAIGNIPLWTQLRQMVWPTTEPIDGVFGTEACTFVGVPALLCVGVAGPSLWWMVLLVSMSLALGRRFPLFRRTHWLQLRIPARYCYFVGVSLAMLTLEGFRRLPPHQQVVVILLQGVSLVLICSRLWPMLPYCQRWERPSVVFRTPVIRDLVAQAGAPTGRVSGLPYPLRTGQINHLHTLGYNGGSRASWMARFRGDGNPNGSAGHDWFALNEDGPLLDWYGVQYALTSRPLTGKWKATTIPHLYENTRVLTPPSWHQMRRRDVHVREDRHLV